MEEYRALCGIHGTASLHQTGLDSDDVKRLPIQAANALTRVFLLKADELMHLADVSPGIIVDRGVKNAAKPLTHYFSGKTGLVRLRADYQDPGQAERGIRALLKSTQVSRKGAILLIGVSDVLFEKIWSRADQRNTLNPPVAPGDDSSESPELRALLDQNPNLEVPKALLQKFLGSSPLSNRIRQLIVLAAKVIHPVLIQGATGTGKEVVARMIHQFSSRAAETFVAVNCGGIPTDLLESELFGHVQGAFTGALRDKTGLWTLADAGTLFLDEISDLPPAHQVKVLRALEDGRYWAVGGEREIQSGARIIAATNRDLWQMVKAGSFRDDLYYRLFTFRIRTPALREHPDDIPELAARFWQKFTEGRCPALSNEIGQELKTYAWPGNARELRSFLINVFTLADSRQVTLQMIRAVMRDRLGLGIHTQQDQ
jgi:transcriptional regulator of acetoin/glycerol metabolism